MQSFNRLILIVIGALLSASVIGQKLLEPYTPVEFMEKGYAFINDSEDYVSAELEFAKIHPNDTLYHGALYNRIVCYRKSSRQTEALELVEESLSLNTEYVINTYLNKVYSLDSLGKKDEAFAVLDEAEKKFPYNYDIKKARAPLLESQGKYEEALTIYKDCIRDEPLNAAHHLSLASTVLQAGGITQAILPLAAALALNPGGENNLFLVKRCNYIVSNKPEIDEPKFDLSLLGEDFEDIDDLVGNYIALDDSYKVSGVFQMAFIKQFHLMISEAEVGDGFFSQTYLKPFRQILEEGHSFAELAALLIIVSEDTQHASYIKENIESIGQLTIDLRNIMDASSEQRIAPESLTDQKVDYLFTTEGKINGMCHYIPEKDALVGPVMYFNSYGSIDNLGAYDSEGRLTGKWTEFHANGEVAGKYNYLKGNLEGQATYYYDSGILANVVNYKNGLAEGRVENYKLIGYKYEDVDYKEGKKHGNEIGYFADKSVQYKYQYKYGKLNGPFEVYYDDGAVSLTGKFVDDLYDGEVISYYRSGQINNSYKYKNGVLDGTAIAYYEDGQVRSKGAYKNDKQLGVWEEYNSAGAMIQIEEYDERGKVSGPTKNLDHLGRIETVYMRKKGKITELINYDTKGEKISTYKLKGNEIKFKNLNVNGELVSEGQFINEVKEGEWKGYGNYGTLMSVTNYKDGLKSGEENNYTETSSLSSKVSYKEGLLDGLSIEYYPNGSFRTQASFKEDNLHGSFVTYNQEGTIMQDKYFINGQLMGTCEYNNCDGTVYLIEEFNLGYPVKGSRYDPNGALSATYELDKGNGLSLIHI